MPTTVLLVDDEALVLLAIETTLQDAGFTVLTARDGAEALRVIEERFAELGALVTDVNLGDIEGWVVARRARELSASLPVIYITGDSAHTWAAQGVPDSVLIEKPFVPVQIVTAISTLMNVTGVTGMPPA